MRNEIKSFKLSSPFFTGKQQLLSPQNSNKSRKETKVTKKIFFMLVFSLFCSESQEFSSDFEKTR